MYRVATIAVLLIFFSVQSRANGFFVASPQDYYWYPNDREASYFKAFPDGFNPCFIELMSNKQTVTIDKDSVFVQVYQTYYNISPDTLQTYYLMPIPAGIQPTGFQFTINQDEFRAELYDVGKSFKVFKDLVHRTGNHQWWVYANNPMYRVNIYKTPPRSVLAVKVTYKYKLTPETNQYAFEYLLGTERYSAKPVKDSEFTLTIKAANRLTNFYSPWQDLQPTYTNEKQATYKLTNKSNRFTKDFFIYYTVNTQPVGYALYTHKEAGKPGYFMLAFDAGYGQTAEEKDLVFAVDVAETMTPAQLEKVKKALNTCIKKLGANDRFNVVTFSNLSESAFPDFVNPTSANITQAIAFLTAAKTAGKANYEGAFNKSLHFSKDPIRPYYVLLISAGEPQTGIVTDHDELMEEVDVAQVRTLRIFTVGIGNNANAAFLERLATYTQGESLFISDDSAIETSLTAFCEQVSNPVLINLQLYFGDNFEVLEMYPKKPANLFKDQTLFISGKYKRGGSTTVSLIGDSKKQMQRYDYTIQFPDKSDKFPFVAQVWAARAIGEMLNKLKADGNDFDGVGEEIMDLAEEHFIINPYTAHLLIKNMQFLSPDKKKYAPRMLTQAGTDYAAEYAGVTRQKGADALLSSQVATSLSRAAYLRQLNTGQDKMTYTDETGSQKKGVGTEYLTLPNGKILYRNAGNLLTDISTQNKGEGERIDFNSDAYLAITSPELVPYLSLGKQLRLEAGGKVYEIQEAPPAEQQEVKEGGSK